MLFNFYIYLYRICLIPLYRFVRALRVCPACKRCESIVELGFMCPRGLTGLQTVTLTKKQNRNTEGCSKLKRSVVMTSSGKNGLNIRTMQVPNGAGPGVRRSKRPLLASRTRCNVLWKPPKFGNKVKIGNKVQFGNKFANWCNV